MFQSFCVCVCVFFILKEGFYIYRFKFTCLLPFLFSSMFTRKEYKNASFSMILHVSAVRDPETNGFIKCMFVSVTVHCQKTGRFYGNYASNENVSRITDFNGKYPVNSFLRHFFL